MPQPFDAVLMIAFDGPQAPPDIRPFLANVLPARLVFTAHSIPESMSERVHGDLMNTKKLRGPSCTSCHRGRRVVSVVR